MNKIKKRLAVIINMKRLSNVIIASFILLVFGMSIFEISTFAEENQFTVVGKKYDLGSKDAYDLSKVQETGEKAYRFAVTGDIFEATKKNGFDCYGVNSGNISIVMPMYIGSPPIDDLMDPKQWHIIDDDSKVVDGIKLPKKIGSGAIIVQTSKDGKAWITSATDTDINNLLKNDDNGIRIPRTAYQTTNVQLTNGCYYRIIVAYKMQRQLDPDNLWITPVKIPKSEEKERVEIYEFYAYDATVNQAETLNPKNSYEFGDVYRVDSQDGFNNPVLIKSNDPHIDWSVGKFYVSGYTDVRMDGEVPVFLKVPGDRAALWFNLEQELDKCNGRTDIKVNYIQSGSDVYFGTPTIDNFGRGALIIRRTDSKNQKERQIYTNYLEASATVGANTRVDLFEEGDYEVALDYQLHYDKPFVFGTTTTKTLTYRIFFEFKVRNGDISMFLRDIDTNKFITNANVAEHGFYIDVAQSQYLNITIKREVLTDSLDGLVEDTKFSGVAKEGRHYTDEGIYTVTVKNLATNDSVTKRIYVGNQDILLAHMKTGKSINEINELLAAGAEIDDQGMIIVPEQEHETEVISEQNSESESQGSKEYVSPPSSEDSLEIEQPTPDASQTLQSDEAKSSEMQVEETQNDDIYINKVHIIPVISILCIVLIAVGVRIKKGNHTKKGGEINE